jgi:replicative DNA helicase
MVIPSSVVHSRSISLLNGTKHIQHAFQNEDEELFALRGGMNRLVGGPLCRGELVAFLAPPKSGKTWWMIDTAIVALTRGQKVLFVSLEMTEDQMIRRFWESLSGCSRFGGTVEGSAFEDAGNGKYNLVLGERTTTRVDLTDEGIQRIQSRYLALNDDNLKFRCYPTGTLTLQKLQSELKVIEVFEHFIPDVIVIDYADIMALPPGKEKRHQLDSLWMGLKGISNERNILVVTASQTGRETVGGKRDADESNIAEAVSKVNHVNRMITINRSKKDKQMCIYRMSCQTMRDGKECFDQLVVSNCLEIGRPWMDDRFMSQVNFPNDNDSDD